MSQDSQTRPLPATPTDQEPASLSPRKDIPVPKGRNTPGRINGKRLASRSSLFLNMTGGGSDKDSSEEDEYVSPIKAKEPPAIGAQPGGHKSSSAIKPPLPPRENKPVDLQVEIPESYGLKRVAGEAFELGSPGLERAGSILVSPVNKKEFGRATSAHDKTIQYLLRERVDEVEAILDEFPDDLSISSEEYLENVHSNDSYIEILSEIQSGNFTNPDKETLYMLLLGSLKVSDALLDVDITSLDSKKFSDVFAKITGKSPAGQQDQIRDMMRIYAVIKKTTPNPLVCYIHTKVSSLKTCLILAQEMEKFVIENKQFEFLLLRSIEEQNAKFIMDKYGDDPAYLAVFAKQIQSQDLWYKLLEKVKKLDEGELLVHNCVIYGFRSIIDTLASVITDTALPKNLKISSNLWKFKREFVIINEDTDVLSNDDSLTKERKKHQFFLQDLEKKKKSYMDLLHNYKQLNEEKFSNEGVLQRLKVENGELKSKKSDMDRQVDTKLSGFEVIKINNEKNEEINSMNEDLKNEIARVTASINELNLG